MRFGKFLFAALMVGILSVTAMAQQGGGGGGGGGRNFDPAAMRERRLTQIKDALAPTDDEWKVLQPKVEKLMDAQMAQMAGRGGRGRGGPGGGGGGNAPSTPLAEAARALQTTLENKDASAEDIKAKLAALRDARAKAKEQLTVAQNELKELVTARQEAVLVSQGMLD